MAVECSNPITAKPVVSQAAEAQLKDWNAYYNMLLAGELKEFADEFIVVHEGKVVAHGADAKEIRARTAKCLGVYAQNLVVPFVDGNESIVLE